MCLPLQRRSLSLLLTQKRHLAWKTGMIDLIQKDACSKGYTKKSAIVEHAQDQQHTIGWEDTKVLDKATRPVQLLVNEALCIQRTPANNRLNCDGVTSYQAAVSR